MRGVVTIAVLLLCAPIPAWSIAPTYPTLDLVVLASPAIALVEVRGMADSLTQHRFVTDLVEALRGTPPRRDTVALLWPTPPRTIRDLLIFYGPGRSVDYVLRLEDLRAGWPAVTDSLTPLLDRDEVMAHVRARLERVALDMPLGDERPFEPVGWSNTRQRIVDYWFAPDVVDGLELPFLDNSVRVLRCPDIELLQDLRRSAQSGGPVGRVWAAWNLRHYPRSVAEPILVGLLADTSTTSASAPAGPGSYEKRTWRVHSISIAAYEALRVLGVDVPPPVWYEQERRWVNLD